MNDLARLGKLRSAGLSNLAVLANSPVLFETSDFPSILETEESLNDGDVVEITPGRPGLHVLIRESDIHHTVFLTNRCNSSCVMCSQPPTRQDDSWLVGEAIQVAKHMRASPKTLGFTGGEPLLLGERLREILDTYATHHPTTHFEILTNGRLLADAELAKVVLSRMSHDVTWLVPLYGHADLLHDYVVQAPGAFDETINGLLTLHSYGQPIQLRIVLIEPVLKNLPGLCEFIRLNLPFVSEVALMGCEPIGFALANREVCEVDIQAWHKELSAAVHKLLLARMQPVLMNLPLCAVPKELWRFAHQSISDWKQVFIAECDGCMVKNRCSGLFAWHAKGWCPTKISAIREIA